MKSSFAKLNVNPKNHRVGDCVVRAIAKALGQTWDETYRELCELGFEMKSMPNWVDCYEEYLKRKGFVRCKMPTDAEGKKYTIKRFIEEGYMDGRIFIYKVANHLSMSDNGIVYDLWDCRSKSIYRFWKIK